MKGNKDAIAVVAITDIDLAADGELNWLFGLACPATQVGIASVHRYRPEFTQEQFSDEQEEYNTMLYRICKTACHEVGHMFGLLHCVYYECAMNGSNDLEKTDNRPIYFCPVCYRKLLHSLQFDHLKRYEALVKVCGELGGHFSEPCRFFEMRHQ